MGLLENAERNTTSIIKRSTCSDLIQIASNQSGDFSQRNDALNNLPTCTDFNYSVVPRLTSLFYVEQDDLIQCAIINALERCGKAATADTTSLALQVITDFNQCQSGPTPLFDQAYAALVRLSDYSNNTLPILIDSYKTSRASPDADKQARYRAQLVQLVGEINFRPDLDHNDFVTENLVLEFLNDALKDSSSEVLVQVARVAKEYRGRACELSGELRRILEDRSFSDHVRSEIVRTIGMIGDSTCIPSIVAQLSDRSSLVRLYSIHALEFLNTIDSTAISKVRDLARMDPEQSVRKAASELLEKAAGS